MYLRPHGQGRTRRRLRHSLLIRSAGYSCRLSSKCSSEIGSRSYTRSPARQDNLFWDRDEVGSRSLCGVVMTKPPIKQSRRAAILASCKDPFFETCHPQPPVWSIEGSLSRIIQKVQISYRKLTLPYGALIYRDQTVPGGACRAGLWSVAAVRGQPEPRTHHLPISSMKQPKA